MSNPAATSLAPGLPSKYKTDGGCDATTNQRSDESESGDHVGARRINDHNTTQPRHGDPHPAGDDPIIVKFCNATPSPHSRGHRRGQPGDASPYAFAPQTYRGSPVPVTGQGRCPRSSPSYAALALSLESASLCSNYVRTPVRAQKPKRGWPLSGRGATGPRRWRRAGGSVIHSLREPAYRAAGALRAPGTCPGDRVDRLLLAAVALGRAGVQQHPGSGDRGGGGRVQQRPPPRPGLEIAWLGRRHLRRGLEALRDPALVPPSSTRTSGWPWWPSSHQARAALVDEDRPWQVPGQVGVTARRPGGPASCQRTSSSSGGAAERRAAASSSGEISGLVGIGGAPGGSVAAARSVGGARSAGTRVAGAPQLHNLPLRTCPLRPEAEARGRCSRSPRSGRPSTRTSTATGSGGSPRACGRRCCRPGNRGTRRSAAR